MAENENSYQSARKDAVKAVAIIGAVAVTSWGYRKFKQHEDDILDFALGIGWLLGMLVMLPVLLPIFIRCRKTIESRARIDIERWTAERVDLTKRSEDIASRFAEISASDRSSAHLALNPVKQQIRTLDQRMWRSAVLLATRLNGRLRKLQAERGRALKEIERYEREELDLILGDNQRAQEALQQQLKMLEENYGAEPSKSFFDAFMSVYYVRLNACALLGFLALVLVVIAAD